MYMVIYEEDARGYVSEACETKKTDRVNGWISLMVGALSKGTGR